MRRLPVISAIAFALLASCGSDGRAQREPQAPLVQALTVEEHRFVDRIDAVGTANAREQVTLTSPITERILRLNFSDGATVRAGQVIAVLAQGQEAAALDDAAARQREAEQQLSRLRELRERGFATNANLDAQIAAAASARAQAAQARAMIADRVIRAPFSGHVSLRNISPGAVVSAGTEIVTIADLSEIKLDFAVPETMLSTVAEGQTIAAEAAAYPGVPFRGTISTISPIVDPQTRSVMIRARLPNPDLRLRPGMLMTVSIEASPRDRLGVPELAVVSEGETRYVFVIGADGKVARTAVKTGTRQNGLVEVTDGLRRGQRVVGDGVVKVADGMSVRVQGGGGAAQPAAK
ncbi:efflux transporter periplasmic adaptor subunit [Tardibacter chloracetimidivorans]|uniref:Efflux transporter periplasmic adaptor subunit n=1 Tax=Tardibacter chloracetimidivorans TaxID=1921510 RepID=A0A1L3ZQW7_9SPHN|nr:efflux RND transporter periplasmic adaptor subunit [Tardibacter chloracetimidivorans]API58021.1 efflux transporter periplasmic adaptor subunit [Tardibacter chloracetimidivorans]